MGVRLGKEIMGRLWFGGWREVVTRDSVEGFCLFAYFSFTSQNFSLPCMRNSLYNESVFIIFFGGGSHNQNA